MSAQATRNITRYITRKVTRYYHKIIFPKYKFNIDTFYASIITALLLPGTHYHTEYQEMRLNSDEEEHLNMFIPREIYVASFLTCFITSDIYLHVHPNDKLIDKYQLIKKGYVIKKAIENERQNEKQKMNEEKRIQQSVVCRILMKKPEPSFDLKKEIGDTDEESLSETETEKEQVQGNDTKQVEMNDMDEIECFIMYLNAITNHHSKHETDNNESSSINHHSEHKKIENNDISSSSNLNKASTKSVGEFMRFSKNNKYKQRVSRQESIAKCLKHLEQDMKEKESIKRRYTVFKSEQNLKAQTDAFFPMKKKSSAIKRRLTQFHYTFTPGRKFVSTEQFIYNQKEKEKNKSEQQDSLLNEILSYSKNQILSQSRASVMMLPFIKKVSTIKKNSLINRNKKPLTIKNYQTLGNNIARNVLYKLCTTEEDSDHKLTFNTTLSRIRDPLEVKLENKQIKLSLNKKRISTSMYKKSLSNRNKPYKSFNRNCIDIHNSLYISKV